jgi:hypothetical protein
MVSASFTGSAHSGDDPAVVAMRIRIASTLDRIAGVISAGAGVASAATVESRKLITARRCAIDGSSKRAPLTIAVVFDDRVLDRLADRVALVPVVDLNPMSHDDLPHRAARSDRGCVGGSRIGSYPCRRTAPSVHPRDLQ